MKGGPREGLAFFCCIWNVYATADFWLCNGRFPDMQQSVVYTKQKFRKFKKSVFLIK